MGVSYHKTYDIICVIDFAAEYSDHLEFHQTQNQRNKSLHNSVTNSPNHQPNNQFATMGNTQ
jgi:hypothetical protein